MSSEITRDSSTTEAEQISDGFIPPRPRCQRKPENRVFDVLYPDMSSERKFTLAVLYVHLQLLFSFVQVDVAVLAS